MLSFLLRKILETKHANHKTSLLRHTATITSPLYHIVTVSALARTIVSEFLQKARMRASGVMVSDLQNPARVWPVCHAVLCCALALVSAGSQPLASDTAGSTGRSGRDNATLVSSLNCQEVSPKDTRRYSKENLSSSLFCKLFPRKPTGSRELGAVKFARGGAARLVTISAGRAWQLQALPPSQDTPFTIMHYQQMFDLQRRKKNRKGKGGKYLKKENIWPAGRGSFQRRQDTPLTIMHYQQSVSPEMSSVFSLPVLYSLSIFRHFN